MNLADAPDSASNAGRPPRVRRWKDLGARLVPVGGVAVGVGAFNLALTVIDSSYSQGLLRVLVAAFFAGTMGLGTFVILRQVLPEEPDATPTVSDDLANSIVNFARQLSAEHKHEALIDLRNRSSRLLHLIGARDSRRELGDLSLESAAALGNRLVQASVLTDDLGWSLFESGETDLASDNIREAIDLCTNEIDSGRGSQVELIDLRQKARRHMAGIEAERGNYSLARESLELARGDAQALPGPQRDAAIAQLDYTASYLVVSELDRKTKLGTQSTDPTASRDRFNEALRVCERAKSSFEEQRDLERAAKAAKLRCRLLGFTGDPTAQREAEAELKAIETKVSRNLNILKV